MAKSISSPVPDVWYPTLAVFMLCIGLLVTASFFIFSFFGLYLVVLKLVPSYADKNLELQEILRKMFMGAWDSGEQRSRALFSYEATSSTKNRSHAKELTTGAVASVFLGFGSFFLLLSSGIYV